MESVTGVVKLELCTRGKMLERGIEGCAIQVFDTLNYIQGTEGRSRYGVVLIGEVC